MSLAAIEWDKLLEAAYVSAAFGIGVLAVAGVAVVASLQGQDRRTAQHSAIAYHVVTGLCVLAIVAAIVFGIYIMTDK
jgi:hypothetical protein